MKRSLNFTSPTQKKVQHFSALKANEPHLFTYKTIKRPEGCNGLLVEALFLTTAQVLPLNCLVNRTNSDLL